MTSSSEDDLLESPLIRRPKKRRQLNKMMIGIDEDDEDFEGRKGNRHCLNQDSGLYAKFLKGHQGIFS